MYKLSSKSLEKINNKKFHPSLRKLILEAIKTTPIDFTVIETVRTLSQQKINVKKGVSKTLKSRHIPENNKSGYCEAIDIAPYPINWKDLNKFKILSTYIKKVASQLHINLTWGGDWGWDYPHYELKRN